MSAETHSLVSSSLADAPQEQAGPVPSVLSVQSDILGNRTYALILRDCFSRFDDLHFESVWYKEDRSIATKVLHRIFAYRVPFIGGIQRNLDLSRIRTELSYGRTARLLLRRRLRLRSYDLLHFHTQIQAFGALDIMRKTPSVISTDMTIAQASRESSVRYPRTYAPSIARERNVFKAAAHVVTFTEWARRSVVEDYGISPTKVSAIMPGAIFRTFSPPDFSTKGKPRILFVGNDFERKGGWDLLRVFERGLAEKAELHLVTNTPLPALPPGVHLHAGILPYSPEWHELFRAADIFALPSHAEALGLVLQEAGGYGLALVGGNVGGIPELIHVGENGLLSRPGDLDDLESILRRLLDDPAMLAAMRAKSFAIAKEHFDADRNLRRLADLLKKVATA